MRPKDIWELPEIKSFNSISNESAFNVAISSCVNDWICEDVEGKLGELFDADLLFCESGCVNASARATIIKVATKTIKAKRFLFIFFASNPE